MDWIVFMLPPLVAAWVFLSLQSYVGLHILARGVIFVDLALAQLATVGIALAMVFGYEPQSAVAGAAGFAFTVLGAALFAAMRKVDERIVPHEALIGITYVVGSALMILVLANSPHGSEEMKALLVGAILWISWGEIGWIVLVYAVIGAVHWLWRERFVAVSYNLRRNERHDAAWDFLFYLLFGVIVTTSVHLAGVLLVFSFLIIPGVAAAFFTTRLRPRLLLAWALGAVGVAAGLAVSFQVDLPSGATIVGAYGVLLIGAIAVAYLRPGGAPRRAAAAPASRRVR